LIQCRPPTPNGFALIASLLFLVVLTVLGISSISTVSLQEHMASNLKEKERASEAAEVAIRSAEGFIGAQSDIPTAKSDGTSGIWTKGDCLPSPDKDAPPEVFVNLSVSFWNSSAVEYSNPPFDDNELIGSGYSSSGDTRYVQKPRSFSEENNFVPYGTSLDPDRRARGEGLFYYRTTGLGFGGNSTAQAIVQSMYMNRWR
jgi:type IV pilus assembly protein PilX